MGLTLAIHANRTNHESGRSEESVEDLEKQERGRVRQYPRPEAIKKNRWFLPPERRGYSLSPHPHWSSSSRRGT